MTELFVSVFLLCEAVEDIRTQKLGVVKLILFGILAVVFEIFYIKADIVKVLLGSFMGIAALAAAWMTKEAIGYGDGVVMLIMGICCGLGRTLQTLILAIIVMIFVSMAIIVKRGVRFDFRIPFIPCLFIGYVGGLLL